MTIRSVVATVLTLMALAVCGRSIAAEAMLFRASSVLSPAEEASVLNADERKRAEESRAHWRIKGVWIARFDASVFGARTISLELPDHSVYRFEGARKTERGAPGYFSWSGTARPAAVVRPASSPETASSPTFADRGDARLELSFDRVWTAAYGTLRDGQRVFTFRPLNSKYLSLVELGLNPSAPPIDAEPPGPRPKRAPRSGPDWPPGLLTDELKASISTSSIGRSLEPGYCNEVTSCGEVTRISCHPEVDGPEMFFNNKTGVLIMACGGMCMGGHGLPGSKRCTACPPPEWERCEAEGSKR